MFTLSTPAEVTHFEFIFKLAVFDTWQQCRQLDSWTVYLTFSYSHWNIQDQFHSNFILDSPESPQPWKQRKIKPQQCISQCRKRLIGSEPCFLSLAEYREQLFSRLVKALMMLLSDSLSTWSYTSDVSEVPHMSEHQRTQTADTLCSVLCGTEIKGQNSEICNL